MVLASKKMIIGQCHRLSEAIAMIGMTSETPIRPIACGAWSTSRLKSDTILKKITCLYDLMILHSTVVNMRLPVYCLGFQPLHTNKSSHGGNFYCQSNWITPCCRPPNQSLYGRRISMVPQVESSLPAIQHSLRMVQVILNFLIVLGHMNPIHEGMVPLYT